MPPQETANFTAPPETHDFHFLLFDMDGTIIDSTKAIEKYWHQQGREIGIPGEQILATSHGRRSIDVLAQLAPDRANWAYICAAEGQVPLQYGSDAVEIPGSRPLLERLQSEGVPWAIVTSGTRLLVTGWLDVMKLAHPEVLVTAEEVGRGKPDPECYLLGAKRLGFGDGGVDGGQCLVLEDAPAGVAAGKAAGFKVVGLATTHGVQRLREAGADWIVKDLRSVSLRGWDARSGKASIEIRDALVM